jgi:MtN3 and saliva related transmembrane protein
MKLLESAPRWAFDWTAALCTTVSFLPQLIRVWQRKSARDISLIMFLLFSFGVACWLVYGIGIGSRPIVAANAITLALSVAILVLKLLYDRKPERNGQ